jgi:hypothetical protein
MGQDKAAVKRGDIIRVEVDFAFRRSADECDEPVDGPAVSRPTAVAELEANRWPVFHGLRVRLERAETRRPQTGLLGHRRLQN